MLDLTKITEDLKSKFGEETKDASEKIAQLGGFIAGMGKARQLVDEYVAQIVQEAQAAAAAAMAKKKAEAITVVKEEENAPNKA